MISRLWVALASAFLSFGGEGVAAPDLTTLRGADRVAAPARPAPAAEAAPPRWNTVGTPADRDTVGAGTRNASDTLRIPRAGSPFLPGGGSQVSPLGDLAVRLRTRGEFGGDWTRFRPCNATIQLSCNPALIPVLQPDVQFGLDVAGTVGDRIVVDVDWDQTREFAGANRFQVYYRGEANRFVQRVEVGDVTFSLPESRFLTRSIPSGNFGVLAEGELGGITLQTVVARQQGARRTREFHLEGFGAGAGVVQEDTLVLDDADWVRGQFFFLLDPGELSGAPHLDALALRPEDAPDHLAPGPAPIQLYRMERDPVLRQQVEGYIRAEAEAEQGGTTVRESGWFRYLRPGLDYYVHPSGLWVALRAPLRPDEALAVTYVSAQGSPIGDYNPEQIHTSGGIPRLRLLRSTFPQHQPGRPTWDLEMKQVYRISGSDEVDASALDLRISLGEESGGRTFLPLRSGRRTSYLRFFGLDEDSPLESVDPSSLFRPARESLEDTSIQGTFLIFPTLRPFLDPPPVPSEGLTARETAELLGEDRNRRIYEAEDPFERDAGGLFRLNLTVRVRSTGVASTFSLGAFGVREGSERIYLGEWLLRPLVDYLIDYEAGVVTLLQPEALLVRAPSGVLRVTWEQAALFRVAPTSLVGASARVPLGERGDLDFIGIYQAEEALVNRPRFGAEPGAVGMLGARSRLSFDLPTLDAFLQRLPGGDAAPPAELRFDGEFAASLPNPNVSGDAFLDDFDSGDERTISLLSPNWHLGSAPGRLDGAVHRLPAVLDETSVGSLVWQHTWVLASPSGDSIGIFDGFLPQQDIDRQINIAGGQTREPGLQLTFGRDATLGAGPRRWRSMTTLLSPSGLDLTQTEYLDFYVAEGDSLTLILDLGLVSEDGFFVDPDGNTSGIRPETGGSWGLGFLDQEGDPLRGEIWGPEVDERGVWPQGCVAQPGRVFRIGERTVNCTRGNGQRDTEDLNGNGVLDTVERHVRYVVTLDGSSPFLARATGTTGTPFRLYRIPLRGPHTLNPGGEFAESDWRAVQFLRVTVAGPRNRNLTLARMRFVGSRWVKRNVDGVLRGMGGDTLALGGRVEVSPVSILSEGAAYQAPPGVLEELDDPASAVSGRGVEFNEKSLALRYEGIGGGDRVEVVSRFLQRPRNFLQYRQLRLWVVARRGEWGGGAPTDFFLKVGSDPENFYLYRSRLEPAANPDAVVPGDWLPERVIDFERWMTLRREAEEALLEGPIRPGDPPVTVWSADSTYAVVLKDRARAPNLAAVREISMGVWNRGGLPTEGEVWVNELRLGGAVRTAGTARFLNMELDGGEFVQARFGYSGRGPDFQQMGETQSYESDDVFDVSGTVQAGLLLPEQWGLDLPVTVSHSRSTRDPFFLSGTDLRADQIPGLRTSGAGNTRVSFGLRSDRVLSGADLRFSLSRSTATTLTTESANRGVEASLGYLWQPRPRTLPLAPGFLDPVLRIFLTPGMLRALREAELRWTPEEISVRTGYHARTLRVDRFDRIVSTASDFPSTRDEAPEAWVESRARIAFRPLEGLAASLDLSTIRDVLETEEGVRDPRMRPVVEAERWELAGTDLGWETHRELVSRVTFSPALPEWLRADVGLQTRYRSDRTAGLFRVGSDSVPELLRNAGGERDLRGSVTFDPERGVRALFGPPPDASDQDQGFVGFTRALARTVRPLTLAIQDGIAANYSREAVDPTPTFQFGWATAAHFRRQDEIRATTLVDRTSISAGSGLSLPASVFLNVNLQAVRTEALDRRSDRDSRVITWPDLRGGVAELPLPDRVRSRLARVSFNAGFQKTHDETSFGGGLLQRRTREDIRIPGEVVFEWANGIFTRYRGLTAFGEGTDPTGRTERRQTDHAISVETRFAPRAGLSDRIEEPLRLSLVAQLSEAAECRVVSGGEGCVRFVDQRNRGINLAVDTRISGVEVGGQASVIDRRSFTGLRVGFTQFQIGIWARLTFDAGPVERLDQRRNLF